LLTCINTGLYWLGDGDSDDADVVTAIVVGTDTSTADDIIWKQWKVGFGEHRCRELNKRKHHVFNR